MNFIAAIPLPRGVRPGALSRSRPALDLLLWLWAAHLPRNARCSELAFHHHMQVSLLSPPILGSETRVTTLVA